MRGSNDVDWLWRYDSARLLFTNGVLTSCVCVNHHSKEITSMTGEEIDAYLDYCEDKVISELRLPKRKHVR